MNKFFKYITIVFMLFSINAWSKDILVNGNTETDIYNAIKQATAGDNIVFPEGTYYLERAIPKIDKERITFKSLDPNKKAIIESSLSSSTWLANSSNNILSHVHFENLIFKKIRLKFIKMTNVNVTGCEFYDGPSGNNLSNEQLFFSLVTTFYVKNNKFTRNIDEGRGVFIYESTDGYFGYNSFSGKYKTAINLVQNQKCGNTCITSGAISPRRKLVQIHSNNIIRTESLSEDHGIYAHNVSDVEIFYNVIKGWTSEASGGGIKFRNSRDSMIHANTIFGSGILLYTYENSDYKYLNNIKVVNNKIYCFGSCLQQNGYYQGISYWRNYSQTNPTAEQNINIYQNKIYGDGQINNFNGEPSEVSIYSNSFYPLP